MFLSILKLLAGVGLFLFAIYLLEESLKKLSGRKFKLFLQEATSNSVRAAASGAIVTALLQSSSMVSLIVLAFVEAGVFQLKNAMAIILGANLGTTIDSWVVATVGFKVNLEVVAYPAVTIGGILLILFNNRKSIIYLSNFLLGFGLLFIGLAFMKQAMESQVDMINFSAYSSNLAFLGVGFLITALVQSSSVTMALTLSALHAGIIGFEPAIALVLGSETGTTVKLLLSAIGGSPSKKRVVLGNVIFNVCLTVGAYAALKFIVYLIKVVFGIADPLIGLVTFSTLINLVALSAFLPFLNPFARFLQLFFKRNKSPLVAYIDSANVNESETAMDLFRLEAKYFIHSVITFNLEQMGLTLDNISSSPITEFTKLDQQRNWNDKNTDEKYVTIKFRQGQIQTFYVKLRKSIKPEQHEELAQLIIAVSSAMQAAKDINDVRSNIENMRKSSKQIKFEVLLKQQKFITHLYQKIYPLLSDFKPNTSATYFEKLSDEAMFFYNTCMEEFYENTNTLTCEIPDITMVLNLNREVLNSNRELLKGVMNIQDNTVI